MDVKLTDEIKAKDADDELKGTINVLFEHWREIARGVVSDGREIAEKLQEEIEQKLVAKLDGDLSVLRYRERVAACVDLFEKLLVELQSQDLVLDDIGLQSRDHDDQQVSVFILIFIFIKSSSSSSLDLAPVI